MVGVYRDGLADFEKERQVVDRIGVEGAGRERDPAGRGVGAGLVAFRAAEGRAGQPACADPILEFETAGDDLATPIDRARGS